MLDFFFFKQKTAYEIYYGLVGSEMCIRDRVKMANQIADFFGAMPDRAEALEGIAQHIRKFWVPVSYTHLTLPTTI